MSNVAERCKRVLSYTDVEAFKTVIGELNGEKKAVIVVSKVAGAAGITRSVIVNTFKLLEIAGVIETKSLGMKGTYIKIIDQEVAREIVR